METGPGPYRMPPHKQYFNNVFLSAALTCAGISVVMMCLPFASIFFASLGMLFAILSKERELVMRPAALIAVGTCMTTITFSVLLTIFSVWFFLNNPEQHEQLNKIYLDSTGVSFDDQVNELFESFGIKDFDIGK